MIVVDERLVAFYTVCPGGRRGFDIYRVSFNHTPLVEHVATVAGTDEAGALRVAQSVLNGKQ